MVDISLQEMLLGTKRVQELKSPMRQSAMSKLLNQQVDELVDQLMADADPVSLKLMTPAVRRAQLRTELMHQFQFSELTSYLIAAFKILKLERFGFLSEQTQQELKASIVKIADLIETLDVQKLYNSEFLELLAIQDSVRDSIEKVAIAKFEEGFYEDCTAIFALLTTLNPSNWDYWFRLGIASFERGKLDLASRAYAAAITLDPEHFETYLFAAECYLKLTEKDRAKETLEQAKQFVSSADEGSRQLFASLVQNV